MDLAARRARDIATRLASHDGGRVGVVATRPRSLARTIVSTAVRGPHGSRGCARAPCDWGRWSQ